MSKSHCYWEVSNKQTDVIKAGMKVILPYVWSYLTDGSDICEASDISVVLEKDTTLVGALLLLEAEALAYVKSKGCNALRDYAIEEIEFNASNKTATYYWGT